MINLTSDNNILKGRLFGHPVHMMLVHFPAALFPLSAIAAVIAFIMKDNILALFNFYIICTGTLIGCLALVFGLIELLQIGNQKKPMNIALVHGGLNTIWLSAFSVIGGTQLGLYPDIPVPALIQVFAQLIVSAAMIYSNFLGGELVLRYNIGKKVK
jgi:uncharacterized membrane protein